MPFALIPVLAFLVAGDVAAVLVDDALYRLLNTTMELIIVVLVIRYGVKIIAVIREFRGATEKDVKNTAAVVQRKLGDRDPGSVETPNPDRRCTDETEG